MVKTILHKSFSTVMALLVLFSTVSFTVEKHFCGDVLIDFAVFSDVEKCKMEAFELEQAKVTNKHCCKDVLEVVEGQDQLKQSKIESIKVQQQVFLVSYLITYANSLNELPKLIIPHKNYSPPDLVEEILILEEVFLI